MCRPLRLRNPDNFSETPLAECEPEIICESPRTLNHLCQKLDFSCSYDVFTRLSVAEMGGLDESKENAVSAAEN
jgi:hypothetical protein